MYEKYWAGLCASLGLAMFAPMTEAQSKVDRVIAATATGSVNITNVAGSLTVDGWDRNEVRVTGQLDDGVERLDFTRQGDRVTIKVILKRGKQKDGDGSAILQIKLPQASRVEVSAVSADVTVAGVTGIQKINSVSGDLTAALGNAQAELRSVSGDTRLRGGADGTKLRVSTVSGDVELRDGAGDLEIMSVSGDIDAQLRRMAIGRVRTTSGDLRLQAALAENATLDAESVSGDVTVVGRAARGMTLDVQSFSGDIRSCFGRDGEPTSKHAPGERLNMKIGDGLASLRIKTLSGDVRVCDR